MDLIYDRDLQQILCGSVPLMHWEPPEPTLKEVQTLPPKPQSQLKPQPRLPRQERASATTASACFDVSGYDWYNVHLC